MSTISRYIISHVFFPIKLPQKDDSSPANDASLTEALLDALNLFQSQSLKQEQSGWSPYVDVVTNILDHRDQSGVLVIENFSETLRTMLDGGLSILYFNH